MISPPPQGGSGHGIGVRILVVVAVVVLAAGYAAFGFLSRDLWLGTTVRDDHTRTVFAASAPDGDPASKDDLETARDIVTERVRELGATDVDVSIDGSSLTVTARGPAVSAIEQIGTTGHMYIRPVIHSMAAEGSGGTVPAPPGSPPPGSSQSSSSTVPPPVAQTIEDERSLRQNTDQNIQVLALQFQASRCADEDALAGQDDPKLPLVTCSQDGTTVYLLAPSIIDGREIDSAASGFDDQYGGYLVDIEFDSEGADTWADFTAANVGTQVAFTVDTSVLSAPEIREAIPGGRTQIAGDFTEDSARELVGVLESGALPVTLTLESSSSETDTTTRASTPVRIGMGVGGVLLILLVAGTVVYLVSARRRTGTGPT